MCFVVPNNPTKSLRVSVPPKNHTTCAPRFAEGQSTSDHQFSASLIRTSSHHVHHVHKLRVSAFLWSYTLALGSCLCDNKSKTRQRQAVVLLLMPPRKPPRPPRPLRPFGVQLLCVFAFFVVKFSASLVDNDFYF